MSYLMIEHLPASVRFLWISDMDPNGVHMHSILKYGCRRTAWTTVESVVCRTLELIGSKRMVIDELEKVGRFNYGHQLDNMLSAGEQLRRCNSLRFVRAQSYVLTSSQRNRRIHNHRCNDTDCYLAIIKLPQAVEIIVDHTYLSCEFSSKASFSASPLTTSVIFPLHH